MIKLKIAGAIALGAALTSTAFAKDLNAPIPGAPPPAAVGDLGMAIMSAVINADATVARGEGVVSSLALGPGNYEVGFGRDITACAWYGSIGNPGFSGGVAASTISLTGRAGATNSLFVQTFDSASAAANRPFHILIYCGR